MFLFSFFCRTLQNLSRKSLRLTVRQYYNFGVKLLLITLGLNTCYQLLLTSPDCFLHLFLITKRFKFLLLLKVLNILMSTLGCFSLSLYLAQEIVSLSLFFLMPSFGESIKYTEHLLIDFGYDVCKQIRIIMRIMRMKQMHEQL